MGVVNVPTNVLDRVIALEQGLEQIRKLAGLTSAIIRRGGLTLLDDSFIKMVDDLGTQVLYVGPNSGGQQIFLLKRENGSAVLQSDYFAGQPFFAMRDQNNVILFSDNAAGLGGMARPWLPVPMQPMFRDWANSTPVAPQGEFFQYHVTRNDLIASEIAIYQGAASILHKFMEVTGIFGFAVGSNAVTYRLRLNGTVVGTWTANFGATGMTTPRFDVSAYLDLNAVQVQVTAQAGGGSAGLSSVQVDSVYMRQ
jgi:hypothetical protein